MRLGRRDLVGIAIALVAAATCVRLGFWQLSRLRQRLARNALARAAWALPPIELVGPIPLDSARNRRVRVRGTYDFRYQRLWRPHVLDEAPGVDLVTPVRLAGGHGVLVDRGWVASPDAYHVDEGAYREPDTVDVLGLALAAPRTRGDVDPARLRDTVPYPLLPFVVQQLPESAVALRPNVPQRLPPPELTNGPHLSYAIQWFSFATIIVIGSAILFWKASRDG